MDNRISPRFYAIDYDRCLGNAERIYTLLQRCAVALASDFNTTAMDRERDDVEASGDSFDELAYVRRYATTAQYRALLDEFITQGRAAPDELLEDGARELLAYVGLRYPFGVLTYGSHDWQLAKIQASLPATVPVAVINHKYKIRHIKQWKDKTTGLFDLPPELRPGGGYRFAREVILVDDKAAAFEGIEPGVRGYWITHRELLPSQKGTVGPLVTRVASFAELVACERANSQ